MTTHSQDGCVQQPFSHPPTWDPKLLVGPLHQQRRRGCAVLPPVLVIPSRFCLGRPSPPQGPMNILLIVFGSSGSTFWTEFFNPFGLYFDTMK